MAQAWTHVYEFLIGRKVRGESGAWHVYDADGNVLSDPAGVWFRSSLGALLNPFGPQNTSLIKYYSGSTWLSGVLKYYDGEEWRVGILKRWNGSNWE